MSGSARQVALAGRRSELAAVTDVLTGRGDSALLLVTGEAGIGKTRLVTAAAEAARSQGHNVLTASCLPLAEAAPLLPVGDLLRAAFDVDRGDWLRSAASRCPDYVPATLAVLVPELADAAQAAPSDALWPQRLFVAARLVLAELGRSHPLSLVLDDAHWSDSSTLDLLDHLLHAGDDLPVPVVVTYRTEDAEVAEHNAAWLARARRSPRAAVLDIGRLSEADTAEQIVLTTGASDPAVTAAVFARSEGNPLFTEQLLGSGGRLPSDLRAVFDAKLRKLGPRDLAVINALAVAGRPLPAALLGRLLDDAGQLDASLRTLRTARLLRSDTDLVATRHALLADAVLADLPSAETARLSRRIAEAMPGWGEHGSVSEIAEHWQQAGDARQELRWRIRAAEAAYAAHANTEAAHHWLRVIAVWDDVPDAEELAGKPLYDVYLTADWAVFDAGMTTASVRLMDEALRRFAAAPDVVRASLLRRQARNRSWTDEGAAADLMELAQDLFDGGPPVAEWVLALSDLIELRRTQARYAEGIAAADKGLAVASACGDELLLHRLYVQRASCQLAIGDLDAASASLEALAEAPAPQTLRERVVVALMHTDLLLATGRYAEVPEVSADVVTTLAQFGTRSGRLPAVLRGNVIEALLDLGRVADAAEMLAAVTADKPPEDAYLAECYRAEIMLVGGDLEAAAAELDRLAGNWPNTTEFAVSLATQRAEVHLWAGRPGDALDVLTDPLGTLRDNDLADRAGWALVQAARAAADLAAVRGDEPAALECRLDELPHAVLSQHRLAEEPRSSWSAMRATWDAERRRLRGADDPDAWTAAAAGWQVIGARFRAAYCRWREAEAQLARRGHRDEAVVALREAASLAENHVPLTRAIEATAARARIALAEDIGRPEPTRRDFGLTERELAVLKLLGAGRSNPEIGRELYMSPKTASVHVTSILRKLGVATRAHAAAVAERAGLLD